MNNYEAEHLSLLRQANAECTLFLKRNNGFPLGNAGEIALYGNGVRHTIKGGTGSGEVNSRFYTVVEKGFLDAGFTVLTKDWLDQYDVIYENARKDFVKEIKARAKKKHTQAVIEGMGAVMKEPEYNLEITKKCATAIYVVSRISGEGNDRTPEKGDSLLTDTEVRNILTCQKLYERFLLVLNVGSPIDLSPIAESVDNILLLSQLGVETGAVLADIVLGKANPSGKLATTWADRDEYCSVGEFGDESDTRYNEGIYVGYRYFDSIGKKTRYPFGYGLSYSDFEIKDCEVSLDRTDVVVKATVINTGRMAGKEVVQAYLSCPEGKLDKAYQDYAGCFKTSCLEPGTSETKELRFHLYDFTSFNEENGQYVLEKGNYIVRVGNSSTNTKPVAVLELDTDIVTKTVQKLNDVIDFKDWKPEAKINTDNTENCPVLKIDARYFDTKVTQYGKEPVVDPRVELLSDEELVYTAIGSFRKGGIAQVVGSASFSVAGAAGETTRALLKKGYPAIVMADGPAGIRISRQYYKDENGAHSVGDVMPETMAQFLPGFVKLIMNHQPKLKKGVELKEQYCTAIPIGTAIAQSFNTEYAEMCGDIVGDEMERFGVHLWLAPALNIHRNILCGRNFEYYSEDPIVSAQMASAITSGVQHHPGCGTTIKHYCANNQETNRYNTNSIISERALREIYLKGFELCIRDTQPCALMTSYNLLNGKHTSERRDLCEDILRSEFGFKGIVMTDWVTGGSLMYNRKDRPMPNAGLVSSAGGDVFMPGGAGDYDRCLKALKEGKVTRHQLEVNATRILKMTERLVNKK